MGRVTSAHVAAVAGVSRATVSYVLNNRSDKPITDATRQAVLAAARELSYNPSPAARALRRGKGDVVVALLPNHWDIGGEIGRLLAVIGEELAAQDLPFVRYQVDLQPGVVRDLLQSVTVACVVSFHPLSPGDQAELERAQVHEVRAWILGEPRTASSFRICQHDIVRVQVEHLIERGCTRIEYAAYSDVLEDDFLTKRATAFASLLSEHGLAEAHPTFFNDANDVDNAVRAWTADGDRVGVCAFSDTVGGHVLAVASRLHIRVPDRLSIIGVDDSPLARFLTPPLSSVWFDLAREARRIVANVLGTLGVDTEQLTDHGPGSVILKARDST